MEDDFNFTWILVTEDIIVLSYETIKDTVENVELNIIKKFKVEERACLK